ncbi:NAD(P)H-dependent FMN reductase [Steroidobacter agaridevorans]|uniref:NAD(P)H-dependent FMN reductase n=1 Tax=Steroidobacter agaridevorans TaxID=2695856 RepID=A0A829YAE5_9GAMM|nr:NADPH-dependent FMN reductase [Steroidobacter agaridevorans]GFE79911.1 NAD(P)H-dependent FMN reductase [Steroidobacter agaridevorans]GFE90120.1 NAD(P)H-dependent FMN reductase [Steroidobacter agaridevorans]
MWSLPNTATEQPGDVSVRPVVLALAGSLRRRSYNKQLLAAAELHARPTLSIRIYEDLGSVPLFNEDLEAHDPPGGVVRLATALVQADALLIATPEYNQGLPGVLKNAIDWLSRSEPDLLDGKPTAILGASAGPWGTRLAQASLRHTLTACGAIVMPQPQIYVREAANVFDSDGALTDERLRNSLSTFIGSFQSWIEGSGRFRRRLECGA